MSNAAGPGGAMGNLVTYTHLVYALHAFAVVTGVIGAASVLGSFLASLPSIAAVLINYLKRAEARGTWLDSHFGWQIRTFWYALLWALIGVMLIVSVVGVLFGLALLLITSVWVSYRVARGWWALGQQRPMPMAARP